MTKGSWKDFFSVDKMMDWGMNLAAILIIILIGLILLKIILRITDRGLKKVRQIRFYTLSSAM